MKYFVYELIEKRRYVPDGYDMKTIATAKLEEIDDFTTLEDAENYVKNNARKHKQSKLVILLVIS